MQRLQSAAREQDEDARSLRSMLSSGSWLARLPAVIGPSGIAALSQMYRCGLGRRVWSLVYLHGCVCTRDIAVHVGFGEMRIAIGEVRVEPLCQRERGRTEDECDREGSLGLGEHVIISCVKLSEERAGLSFFDA
jgi:hypothetical protein